jgi:tetratricopeptide (TPR) repeat protein
MRELGAVQNAAGNFAAAEESFTKALRTAADDDQTNYNMAVVKIALDKGAEAVMYAKRALDKEPSSDVYAYTLGLACESSKDTDGALGAYIKAAGLNPRYVKPRVNLGRLYLENGFPQEALKNLAEAYRIEPNNFEVNNNMGAVYARLEEWASSVEHYEKALAVEINNPTVRLNLARACLGLGDLAKARDAYRETLRITPDNWDAVFELGKTCASLGEAEAAKKYLQDLLKRNPGYTAKAEAEKILAGL